jgi:hypothetical protein
MHYYGDQIKEEVMAGVCSTYENDEIQSLSQINLKERDCLGDLDGDERQ